MRQFSLICNWSWGKVDKIGAYDPVRKIGRTYSGYSSFSLNRVERAIKANEKSKRRQQHTRA